MEQRARERPVRVPHLRRSRSRRRPALPRRGVRVSAARCPRDRASRAGGHRRRELSAGPSPCGRWRQRRRWCCSAAPWRGGPAAMRAAPCSPPRSCRFSAARSSGPTSTSSPSRSCSPRCSCSRAIAPGPALRSLGLAVMTKVFPIVVAPVAIAWLVARGRRRDAWQGALACAAVMAAIAVAAVAASPDGALDAVRYHLDRPVQIESSPAWCCWGWTRPVPGTPPACRASGRTASSTRPPTLSRHSS